MYCKLFECYKNKDKSRCCCCCEKQLGCKRQCLNDKEKCGQFLKDKPDKIKVKVG